MEGIEQLPKLILELYAIVGKLEDLFPGRHFTPDGHLVGSIGEVLAARRYGLALWDASAECHDATAPDGRPLQIKATQKSSIGLRSRPNHLLVLHITENGTAEEVYNGPGDLAWMNAGKMQKNGQRSISVAKLKALMDAVGECDRVPPVRDWWVDQ
jgi:hypothetical protein